MTDLALAIDLGTTSISAVAVAADGTIVDCRSRSHRAAIDGLPDGHAEQDPEVLRREACAVLREMSASLNGTPRCLGLTGQMHSVAIIDQNRVPLTPLITWQDRRSLESTAADGTTYLDAYLSRCREEDLRRTGCRLSPGYAAVTLSVLQQQGKIPAEAHRMTFAADWLAAELADAEVVTDRSNAASSGVFDLVEDRWSSSLLETGELETSWFPPVRDSGGPLGGLTPAAAEETGLPAGLPICTPLGDNQAAVLGSVPAGTESIQINVGTGGQINWPIAGFDRQAGMDTRYLPPGRWMLVGAGLVGGDAYAWVRRTIEEWLAAFGYTPSEEMIYARLNELARSAAADAGSLRCSPLFRGSRQQPEARGVFEQVTARNFTPGNIARAVLRGIAEGFHSFLAAAGDAGPTHADRLIGSGNGLRANRLLVEAIEERFGLPMWFPAHREEAAVGAALLAGAMTGVWPDLDSATANIRLTRSDESVEACR